MDRGKQRGGEAITVLELDKYTYCVPLSPMALTSTYVKFYIRTHTELERERVKECLVLICSGMFRPTVSCAKACIMPTGSQHAH